MGIKDRLFRSSGMGADAVPPLPELSPEEAEVAGITRKLEHERQTREGFGRFLRHPVRTLTEKPVNILIVCIPISLILFIGGFISMVNFSFAAIVQPHSAVMSMLTSASSPGSSSLSPSPTISVVV